MGQRELPEDMVLAQQLAAAADNVRWCMTEQYHVEDSDVLRGGNELVSFYSRPDPVQAAMLAIGLEKIIGLVRRQNALATLDRIDKLSQRLREAITKQQAEADMLAAK